MTPPEGLVYETSEVRLRAVREAGVEVLVGPPRTSLTRRMTYIPDWAHATCEGTVPGKWREFALQRAARDEEFRDAVLAAWLLGGGAGAAKLIDATADKEMPWAVDEQGQWLRRSRHERA